MKTFLARQRLERLQKRLAEPTFTRYLDIRVKVNGMDIPLGTVKFSGGDGDVMQTNYQTLYGQHGGIVGEVAISLETKKV